MVATVSMIFLRINSPFPLALISFVATVFPPKKYLGEQRCRAFPLDYTAAVLLSLYSQCAE